MDFETRDILALIILVGCIICKILGKNDVVDDIIMYMLGFYFSYKLVKPKRH